MGVTPGNLFPLPQIQQNRSLGDAPGKWHRTHVNPAVVTAKLTVGSKDGSLEIFREGKPGVSSWRINLTGLAAGAYTLDTGVTSSEKALIDIYAFDAKGKSKLIFLRRYTKAAARKIGETIEIPEGTVRVRFGFGVEDNGIASYKMPRLFTGKLPPETLPPRAGENRRGIRMDLLPRLGNFEKVSAQVRNTFVIDPFTGIKVELNGGTAAENGVCRKKDDGTWLFTMKNRPVDTTASAWTARFPAQTVPAGTLFQLSYVLKGICYTRIAYPVLYLNDVPLLYSSECYNDGLPHTVVGMIPKEIAADQLKLHLRTDGEELSFHMTDFQLFPDVESLPGATGVTGKMPDGTEKLALEGVVRQRQRTALKEALELRQKVYDYTLLGEGDLILNGLGFHVDDEWNVLYGKDAPAPSGLGKKVGTVPLRGHGQAFDHVLTLTPTGKAKELWLLLGAQMPAFGRTGATPVRPPQFAAHEVVSAEIEYADGTVDHAFPYSPADKGFSIQRFTGAYAVPLDPDKELRRVRLHSYFRPGMGEIFLMAATLNRTAPACIPEKVLDPPRQAVTRREPPAGKQPLKIVKDDRGVVLENDWYKMRIATADGFRITELQQKIVREEPLTLDPESGLEIDWKGKTLTGRDFRVTECRMLADGVLLQLSAKPETGTALTLTLRITGGKDGEIVFRASMKNTGTARIAPRTRFPLLKKVRLGKSYEDNWIYFPKYYSLHSNQLTYAHCPGNERAYFVQFYDAYNPAAGYGLELMTHNLDSIVLDYGLHKGLEGLQFYIQYPAPWYMMDSGESKDLAETTLNFHVGDWHQAFRHYKAWVRTWYKPVKKGKLEWWLDSQVARCEFFNKQYDWVLPIYLEKEDRFRLDELLDLGKRRWGTNPDILHLWGWNCPPLYPGEAPRRGTPRANYADGEFAPKNYFKGPERLGALLKKQQDDGMRISLYAIPSYLPKACPVGKARGKDVVQIQGNGQPLVDDQCYFPCIWAWMDTFVAACARAQKALHFDALYVDISPFPRDYTCYSTRHGHSVPLNINLASRQLFRKIRDVLPEGVAFWHEDPAADVETQWSSGCMTYYHVTGSENRAPNYAETTAAPTAMPPRQSILRFAFPKYKMFAIPIGLTNGNMNMRYYHNPFFNGEGYSDSTTGLYNDRTMPIMRRALQLQKQFAHLYNSDSITPMIETEAAEIYANEFDDPESKQTLWTLYNGRFQTYRGAVLKVPYQPGDQFKDVWNDRILTPEIQGNYAVLALELPPQMVGAILRIRR